MTDRYPISLLIDLLDAPRKVRIYLKIDLKSTYYLVCIAKGDEWKTTFYTHYGSFKWLVMPFGLLNALFAFQQFINEVFYDLLDIYIVIYFNNILVYSNNLEDHKKHVKEVLRRLQNNKLNMSPTKCVFYQNKIEFLGFILGSDGLRIDESQI